MADSQTPAANQTSPPPSPTASHATDQGLVSLQTLWDESDWHEYRYRAANPYSLEDFYNDEDDYERDVHDKWVQEQKENERFEKLTQDWSQSDRGSHVEFAASEGVPLKEGNYLGRGAVGDVYQTEVMGYKLAWKRIPLRRQVGQKDLKEIEILKKLSHAHMIKLIGTYTHRQCLGLLLKPVAVCDLHTFFDDVESYWASRSSRAQNERLRELAFCGSNSAVRKAGPIYFQIGCLVSAVAYLHEQKVRHKDLKPSNILLASDGLYLSDFGSATDFSLLSQSATDNERGTPKYFAPEVAEWEPNGRAADIFSLGCILLEILILNQEGTLHRLRSNRSAKNTAYQANLDQINNWIPLREDVSQTDYHLVREIRAMLCRDPKRRPTAEALLRRLTYVDKIGDGADDTYSIFGSCCRERFKKESEYWKELSSLRASHEKKTEEVRQQQEDSRERMIEIHRRLLSDKNAAETKIKDLETKHENDTATLKALYESVNYGAVKDTEKAAQEKMRDMEKKHSSEIVALKALYESIDTQKTTHPRDVPRTFKSHRLNNETPPTVMKLNNNSDGYLAGDEKPTATTTPSSDRPERRKNKSAPSVLPDSVVRKPLVPPPIPSKIAPAKPTSLRSFDSAIAELGGEFSSVHAVSPEDNAKIASDTRADEVARERELRMKKFLRDEGRVGQVDGSDTAREASRWQRLKLRLGSM